MPAKNSEAIFWRPRFTRPPPGRQKSEREFCLFGGVFLRPACRAVCRAGRFCAACRCLACWLSRPVFRREFPAAALAAVRALCRRWACVLHLCFRPACLAACFFCAWPALPPVAFVFVLCCRGLLAGNVPACFLARIFLLSFAFSCLTFVSQNSFHLSLRPRRASTFFRKESRQRFAKGLRPFEPHSCALRLIFFSSALLAGLRGPLGRKPPAGKGNARKSQRAKLSFFERFCAKGNAGALWLFFPSSALLAGLRGPLGRKPPADGETLEKPRSKAQLFKRFCAKGDACALRPVTPFFSLLAGLTALRPQFAGWQGKRPKSQRSRAQLFGRFCAWGCAGARYLRVPAAGNRGQASCLPGKTEAVRGRAPGTSRVRARRGEEKDRSANCPPQVCANCSAQPRAFSLPGKTEAVRGGAPEPAACVRDVGKKKTGSANCPPQVYANCSAQPRRRKSSAKLCGKRLDNSDKLYYNKLTLRNSGASMAA